jgi:phosphotransferase system enzyme I (PtsI)
MSKSHHGYSQKSFKGRTICPGIAIGPARILGYQIAVKRTHILHDQIEEEQNRYSQAVDRVAKRLDSHIEEMHEDTLFDAWKILQIHKLMVDDTHFHETVHERISTEHKNVEWALFDESSRIIRGLEDSRDSYLQARVEDVWDLTNSILLALSSEERYGTVQRVDAKQIFVSKNLYVSEVVRAKRHGVQGFATESSAFCSHAAILLKGFGIPAICGIKDLVESIHNGDTLVVDGLENKVIKNPRKRTLRGYSRLQEQLHQPSVKRVTKPRETSTKDGTRIFLLANIDNKHQTELVLRNRLEGVGLLRTEFLALNSERFPSEEEQYRVYSEILDTLSDRQVTIRTFDLGADKLMPGMERRTCKNPALGIRGIRRQLLIHPEELSDQLRAILKAAFGKSVGILIPMVTTVGDVIEVKKILKHEKRSLKRKAVSFCADTRLGAMIETPAAAFEIQDILSQVDFVSVGTNDLIQYTMAADRDNEAVLRYGDMKHKAVQSILQFIMDRAIEVGRQEDVLICGEIASDPQWVPLLLALGYRSLSISPVSVDSVRASVIKTELK